MLSSQPDPNNFSEWNELDYFRRPRALLSWRKSVVRTALVVGPCLGGIFLLLSFTWLPSIQSYYQAGPVAAAHAMFNNDCNQCHTEPWQTAQRFWHQDDRRRSVPDAACLKCHDGPPHHDQQVTAPNCGSCHREHRGQTVLAQVADEHCTACHADLQTKSGDSPFQRHITGFNTDHPEFGRWQGQLKDPGTIRFNHRVHLQSEGVFVLDREQQRGLEAKEAGGHTLDRRALTCTDCHQIDGMGRYMLPINYEQHCGQCHPLSVQVVGDWKDTKLRRAVEDFSKQPAPHKEPRLVRSGLRERFTEFVQQWPVVQETPNANVDERPIPGWKRPEPLTEKQWEWIDRQLAHAENVLFDKSGGCRYCHEVKEPSGARRLPQYALSGIPKRWLPHSRFRHAGHRMMQCLDCHGQAVASAETRDVLLPAMQTCQQCHAPGAGARTHCVECHSYHDHPRDRDPNGPFTIEEILGGRNAQR